MKQHHKPQSKSRLGNYAFIDSQNLNLSINNLGWKLDFKKFRVFLKDKYQVKKAYLFMGYVAENESMYEGLRNAGYEMIFKPTLEQGGVVKGNCDAELVLKCMVELNKFDKAVIVSGDGDFHCLVDYLKDKGKLLKIGIPNKTQYSSLLRPLSKFFFYISDSKSKLTYQKRTAKKESAKKQAVKKQPVKKEIVKKEPTPKRAPRRRRRRRPTAKNTKKR